MERNRSVNLFSIIHQIGVKPDVDHPDGNEVPAASDGADGLNDDDDGRVLDDEAERSVDGAPQKLTSLKRSNLLEDGKACSCCMLKFDDVPSQRTHFKSDFHALNLKRRMKGQKSLSLAEAEEILEGNVDDLESLSGSDSDEEASEDNETDIVKKSSKNPIYIGLKSTIDGVREIAWAVRTVVMDYKEQALELSRVAEKPIFAILLVSAGHFAGLVVNFTAVLKGSSKDSTPEVIAQKSFHRYVVRKKQGKAQSMNDESARKAQSVGAQLRRHHERAMKVDIGSLLEEWHGAGYLQENHALSCSRIFLASSRTNRRFIFQNESILSRKDARLRRVPFPTRRPTVAEARLAIEKLCNVKLENEKDYEESKRREILAQSKRVASKKETSIQPVERPETKPVKIERKDPDEVVEFMAACERGDIGMVKDMIQQEDSLRDCFRLIDGFTPLHVATVSGHASMVQLLLLEGFSPSARDLRGRLPYHCSSDSKEIRDAYRQFRGNHPDLYDYDSSGIPAPITKESEALKKAKAREKKKRQATRKKAEKAEMSRRAAEELRKKQEEEAAILAATESCTMCEKKLIGPSSEWFHQLEYHYCSVKCMQEHRRTLMSAAAERRRNIG